jgi:hypothetical protein
MLAELVEVVIGVDTHKDTHTAAVVDARTGAVLARATVPADPDGYAKLPALAKAHSGLRAWAMDLASTAVVDHCGVFWLVNEAGDHRAASMVCGQRTPRRWPHATE